MIKMKELVKSYGDGRRCSSFVYEMKNPEAVDDPTVIADAKIPIRFNNTDGEGKNWRLCATLSRNEVLDSQTYTINYAMPLTNMRLEIIAATGMKYLQALLQQEIQKKATLDFALGELLEGM